MDKLPNSAYDSPEALIEALKDIEEEKHLFGYKNGSGYYFKGNVLKARLLEYGGIRYTPENSQLQKHQRL